MHARGAKDFLVQQTVEQASAEHLPFSDLEKRMMYFTETGDCPEDPIVLNNAFEAEYDSTAYEKKVSRLMAQAYRRIKQESPERLRLWNEAVCTLRKGDHYILGFLPPSTRGRPARTWLTYVLTGLFAAGLWALIIFFFGNKGGMRRGEPAPADNYIPALSPLVQHTILLLFLLAVAFAIFPQLLYKLTGFVERFVQPTWPVRRRK
jgi:hypothetical protein